MRTGPLPQPGNYLGDDPDLTAELGQRLASTAQTTQGLMTNYLFYGQRRATDSTQSQVSGRAAEVGLAESLHEARSDTAGSLSATVAGARREVDQPPADQGTPSGTVVTAQQAEAARLTFRVVGPPENTGTDKAAQVVGPAGDEHRLKADDQLAVDGLTDDPSQRDPLANPAADSGPGRVTLGAEGPTRGR